MKTVVFNSSMPRSGSELLQVILHQNPAIYGSITSALMPILNGIRGVSDCEEARAMAPETLQKGLRAAIAGAAQGYYVGLTDRPIVIDKCRGWGPQLEWLKRWNSDKPKVLGMVRDLRGIAASMETRYQKNIDTKQCAMLPNQLSKRIPFWLNMERSRQDGPEGTPPVGSALVALQTVLEEGYADQIHFIKYEELCAKPEETLKAIYEYLELEPYLHDFTNIQKEVEEAPNAFGVFGHHEVASELHPPRDWNTVLPQKISDEIRQRFDWYYKALNY